MSFTCRHPPTDAHTPRGADTTQGREQASPPALQYPEKQKRTLHYRETPTCSIRTPTVKRMLSPALSLLPLGKRDGFFFSLLKNIDFKNKHFCIPKQAVLPELHILISIFIVNFLLVELEKIYNLIMSLVAVRNQSH